MNDQGHLVVDFRNPDGSRSFCGNGTRTALAWAHDAGLISPNEGSVTIKAVDGVHHGLVRAKARQAFPFWWTARLDLGSRARLRRPRRFWTPGRGTT